MTVVLDQKIAIGRTVVAALVSNSIAENYSDKHVLVTGSKIPVVLLIRRGDHVTAFTVQGNPITHLQVDDLCPGAISDFISMDLM